MHDRAVEAPADEKYPPRVPAVQCGAPVDGSPLGAAVRAEGCSGAMLERVQESTMEGLKPAEYSCCLCRGADVRDHVKGHVGL